MLPNQEKRIDGAEVCEETQYVPTRETTYK